MADLQSSFRKFDETIRLTWGDDLGQLRERRDRVLRRLQDGLARQRAAGAQIPAFTSRNQGSYVMGTGVKPIAGDYDIDVALEFELAIRDQPNPVRVKEWVYEAVKNHTQRVEVRGPCVTVYYTEGGEPSYHVDLAIFAVGNSDGATYMARGKLHSGPEHREWLRADPKALIDLLEVYPSDAQDREQFRRVIRFLKRWKDVCFSSEGDAAPRGIALTACAYRWFQPSSRRDPVSNRRSDDDADALVRLVRAMLSQFRSSRLRVDFHPIPPGRDLFERMNDEQMQNFQRKLEALRDALDAARSEASLHAAEMRLQSCFGADFPVPGRDASPARAASSVGTSGASA